MRELIQDTQRPATRSPKRKTKNKWSDSEKAWSDNKLNEIF